LAPFLFEVIRFSLVGNTLPKIAITMGDPAGIGPEICVKALSDTSIFDVCDPSVVGDIEVLRQTAKALKSEIEFEKDVGEESDKISVFETAVKLDGFNIGIDTAETGKAAASYIEKAVELWRQGSIAAIATAPISKKALSLAGYAFPGHTEFLAHLTGTKRVGMSFFGGDLRVVLLSTHLALSEAIKLVTKTNLIELIKFSDNELNRLLARRPKIAVAGLNPHASENGMFGREELDEIVPAIAECKNDGIDVSGPYSPDTIFLRCYRGEFDAVVALYHDQATIPVKAFSFGSAVNVTLGLPLIRTSVDHGTAFDIAGKGVADASSMISAITLAAGLVTRQKER
jgi:4-hydroxythreonine-4-phosphate dehydrogenase